MKRLVFALCFGICYFLSAVNAQSQTFTNQIIITNFLLNGSSQPLTLTPTQQVYYSFTMSKPSGYHGAVNAYLVLGTASGPNLSPISPLSNTPREIDNIYATNTRYGWASNGNGRDIYDVNRYQPSPVGSNNYFMTNNFAFSNNPTLTHLYVVLYNTTATNYANPGALRGISQGIPISRTPPCLTTIYLQNRQLAGIYSAGQSLLVGRSVNTSAASGPVTVLLGSTADLLARTEIVLAEGFEVAQGANLSATIDPNVCSNSLREDTTEEQSKISASLAVDVVANETQVAVYPNPASDEVLVRLPENGASREGVIYNSYGRKVQQFTLPSGQSKVDVRTLTPGIYYIHTQVEGKVIKTRFRVAR
jgi:hypothetical protein